MAKHVTEHGRKRVHQINAKTVDPCLDIHVHNDINDLERAQYHIEGVW